MAGAALLGLLAAGVAGEESTYRVVESESAVLIHVGKAGLFSFAGHRHEVEAPAAGTVIADSERIGEAIVHLSFAGARLRVRPDGEPEGDAPKVQAIMHGPQVLDIARFPEIHFRSTKVMSMAVEENAFDLMITGTVSLRGAEREVTTKVHVTIEGRRLTASGRIELRHDQFGIKPVSAGAGTVKVANEIPIDFSIVAERAGP